MNQKTYLFIAGIIFSVVCVVHFLRVLLGWNMVIGAWAVPLWISVLGFIVTGVLACFGFYLRKNN